MKTKKCARSKITNGAEFPNQPHLVRLRELNLTFPQAWITTSGEIKVDVKETTDIRKEEEEEIDDDDGEN